MMTDNFDRTPGAGRVRGKPTTPGLGEVFNPPHPEIGDGDAKSSIFNQCEPLRQPRTSPPLLEGSAQGGGGKVWVVCSSQDFQN